MKSLYLAVLVVIIACSPKQNPDDQNINYLEQEKPGNTPEVFGKEIVSVKGRFDIGFTISPDGKSMAFGVAHESDPEETAIYIMSFIDGEWTVPSKDILPNNINTFFPMFGPTGGKLYYAKSTEGTETDFWVADYSSKGSTNLQPLGSVLNSDSREAGHGMLENGSFYFTSNRDDRYECCGDIYYSEPGPEGYIVAQKVEELSSSEDEEGLFLSPQGDYIIIQAWRNEFASKHDLYISYKTKTDSWTSPERLNSSINSREIEQRPYVSPDKQFLFFSRTSVTQVNGQDSYESDIYWVSTKSVFKPYLYNSDIDTEVKYNEPFTLYLPKNLFKDVDDSALSYKALLADNSALPEWMKFDAKSLSVNGTWRSSKPLTIKITATDSVGNTGSFEMQPNIMNP